MIFKGEVAPCHRREPPASGSRPRRHSPEAGAAVVLVDINENALARRGREAYLGRSPGDRRDLQRGGRGAGPAAMVERTVATFGKLDHGRSTMPVSWVRWAI